MSTAGLIAQFTHLAQNRDFSTIRIQLNQSSQRRFHRIGIGVVAIVEKLHSVDFFNLQACFGQWSRHEAGRAFFERKTKGSPSRNGQPPGLDRHAGSDADVKAS